MKRGKKPTKDDALDMQLRILNEENIRQDIVTKKAIESKTKKEEEKIALEIEQIKTAWFRKPQWAMVYSSLILGLCTYMTFFKQNSFQIERATSQYKTTHLEQDKDSLHGIIINYQKIVPVLKDTIDTYKVQFFNLQLAKISTNSSKQFSNSVKQEEIAGWGELIAPFYMNSILADSTIKVSDEEITAYVNSHKFNRTDFVIFNGL
jgi:hypothetical protein